MTKRNRISLKTRFPKKFTVLAHFSGSFFTVIMKVFTNFKKRARNVPREQQELQRNRGTSVKTGAFVEMETHHVKTTTHSSLRSESKIAPSARKIRGSSRAQKPRVSRLSRYRLPGKKRKTAAAEHQVNNITANIK